MDALIVRHVIEEVAPFAFACGWLAKNAATRMNNVGIVHIRIIAVAFDLADNILLAAMRHGHKTISGLIRTPIRISLKNDRLKKTRSTFSFL